MSIPGPFICILMLMSLGSAADAVAVPVSSTADVVVVGDSTVQDWPLNDSKRGWGQILPTFFADQVKVLNLAAGGRSSKTFRAEGRWDKVLAAHPKLVLVQFGHNDAHGGGRPEATDAQTDFSDNMRRYVTEAKAAGMVVVLVTPPPHRTSGARSDMGLSPYAIATRAVAKEQGVLCIDLFATGSELFKGLGEDGCLPLFCSAEDRSHFSARGAGTFARMVAEALAQEPSAKLMLRARADWPATKP